MVSYSTMDDELLCDVCSVDFVGRSGGGIALQESEEAGGAREGRRGGYKKKTKAARPREGWVVCCRRGGRSAPVRSETKGNGKNPDRCKF